MSTIDGTVTCEDAPVALADPEEDQREEAITVIEAAEEIAANEQPTEPTPVAQPVDGQVLEPIELSRPVEEDAASKDTVTCQHADPGEPADSAGVAELGEWNQQQQQVLMGYMVRNRELLDAVLDRVDVQQVYRHFLHPTAIFLHGISQFVDKHGELPQTADQLLPYVQPSPSFPELSDPKVWDEVAGQVREIFALPARADDQKNTLIGHRMVDRFILDFGVKPKLQNLLQAKMSPVEFAAELNKVQKQIPQPAMQATSVADLVKQVPAPEPPVAMIKGLVARGELLGLVAPPKVGKTLAAIDLGLSVALGKPWMGYPCSRSPVIYVDSEMGSRAMEWRVHQVVQARGYTGESALRQMELLSIADQLRPLSSVLAELRRRIDHHGCPCLVILDAWYRFGLEDENSNAETARVLGEVVELAVSTDSTVVIVHHTSKGNQSSKRVTDIGSGAGAFARLVGSHLTLIDHEEDGAAVVQAVSRNYPSPKPVCWRFDFPLWHLALELDPNAKRGKGKDSEERAEWTVERVLDELLMCPVSATLLYANASTHGLSDRRLKKLLDLGLNNGQIELKVIGKEKQYRRGGLTTEDVARQLWKANPGISARKLGAEAGCGKTKGADLIKQFKSEECLDGNEDGQNDEEIDQ